ncbi:N-6 DNA methylase [Streptosporangium sp. OZ121]|uniref:N-6 DNA methylase n=1 Tax=Streptosporangium sp. OZ121 TaxID=3444183 RepID=UPI003F7A9488
MTTNRPDGYVSRSDIARLAEVRRPAVTNWERRHRDFPSPVPIGGEELFETSVIGAWLDRRVIASNMLMAGEPAGSTYGTRFRRNLAMPSDEERPVPVPAPSSAPPGPSDEEDVLWEKLMRLRGPVDPAQYRDLVLILVYLRVRRSGSWGAVTRDLREGHGPIALARLSAEVDAILPNHWMLDWAGFGTLNRSGRRLAGIADAVDQAVDRRGGAEVFHGLLGHFALLEGRKGGNFHTPDSVVRALVEVLSPDLPQAIHDPACGTGELLVAAAARVREASGRPPSSVRGETSDGRTLTLAGMNLTLHGVDADLATRPVHELWNPYPRSRFEYVVTNPPFNMGDWYSGDPDRGWWPYGAPPAHNANFAWLQHAVGLLARGGRAAVVMAPNAAYSENERERAIRAGMVEDGCVEGVIALPPRLFSSTAVAVTVWLLTPPTESREEVFFVDASRTGRMVTRTRRELGADDIREIGDIVARQRRGEEPGSAPATSVPLRDIRDQDYNLNPRKHVVPLPAAVPGDGRTVEALLRKLDDLHVRAAEADARAEHELRRLGW